MFLFHKSAVSIFEFYTKRIIVKLVCKINCRGSNIRLAALVFNPCSKKKLGLFDETNAFNSLIICIYDCLNRKLTVSLSNRSVVFGFLLI